MKDIGGIDPQLKSIAKKIPYNRLMIKLAKPYQTLALKGTKLLEGVACRRILLKENGRNLRWIFMSRLRRQSSSHVC